VLAVGDVASVHINGRELPMLSPPAMQESRHVAEAILADLCGTRLREPFRYRDKGTMAVIGRNAAVASVWRLQLTGLPGSCAWLTVHISYLIGFRNRAVVLINRAWNYLRKDRPIRMITSIERDPLAD
jgi:NADH:ubiquinone reductase (H+-translocating)